MRCVVDCGAGASHRGIGGSVGVVRVESVGVEAQSPIVVIVTVGTTLVTSIPTSRSTLKFHDQLIQMLIRPPPKQKAIRRSISTHGRVSRGACFINTCHTIAVDGVGVDDFIIVVAHVSTEWKL